MKDFFWHNRILLLLNKNVLPFSYKQLSCLELRHGFDRNILAVLKMFVILSGQITAQIQHTRIKNTTAIDLCMLFSLNTFS